MSDSLWPHGLYSPGQNTGLGSLSLLQRIFPTQPSCTAGRFFTNWATRETYEYWNGWAYPFSIGSSWPGNWTRVSCVTGGFFTNWATRETASFYYSRFTALFLLYSGVSQLYTASLVAQLVKNLPTVKETQVWFPGWEDPLGKEVATHSGILTWRIPWRGAWQASP